MYNYREFMNNVQSTLIKPGNGACRLSSFTDSVIQEVIRWVYTPYSVLRRLREQCRGSPIGALTAQPGSISPLSSCYPNIVI
jgi:hypothetical protein